MPYTFLIILVEILGSIRVLVPKIYLQLPYGPAEDLYGIFINLVCRERLPEFCYLLSLTKWVPPPVKMTSSYVAERFIAVVDESSKPPLQMGFFINYNAEDILKQANESTLRHQKGEPISVLDGVLVAIKGEIDCLPYPTTGSVQCVFKSIMCHVFKISNVLAADFILKSSGRD